MKGVTIYHCAQSSPEWFQLRKGLLTMSNAAAAIGINRFETPEKLANYITGKEERVFSERSLRLMKMGSEREEEVREWYRQVNPEYKVSEIGFAIPDWCSYIGCSPDGLVNEDGIIEIKHTVSIYDRLMSYYNYPKDKKMKDFIPESHYAQIQGNLGILGRKWCDYIVKEFDGPEIMLRVPFDKEFWFDFQKPRMLDFVDRYLRVTK